MDMSLFFSSRARVIVVFPAPEGEERTYIKPRRLRFSIIVTDFFYACYYSL